MKIGVISDTHGNVQAVRKALEFFYDADLIVHSGDVLYHPPRLGWEEGYDVPALVDLLNGLETPFIIAQGNCDAQVYEELLNMPVQSPYAYTSFNGISIIATHGHLLSRNEMISVAERYKANYFVSGHTHIPVLERVGDLVLMNPGSPSIPRYSANGVLAPSVGIITDSGAKVININDGSILMEI